MDNRGATPSQAHSRLLRLLVINRTRRLPKHFIEVPTSLGRNFSRIQGRLGSIAIDSTPSLQNVMHESGAMVIVTDAACPGKG